jgi:carotenoid cleavage dioxygenase
MGVTIHRVHTSTLPVDDDHPYRSGAWRPQHIEYDATNLPIQGSIPDDLEGVYLRNTENPLHPNLERYHPFDGDGMIHMMAFSNGDAVYRNRFVSTQGLAVEAAAGSAQWSGLAESPLKALRSDGWGARTRMKDASSTDVVVHAGLALSSFYQCGDLYQMDPLTLEDRGRATWNGKFPKCGVSAHTKVDENTNELLFFNYETTAPFMHYGVVDANHELVHYVPIDLPGARLPHDMAFTENFAILNDCPLFWDEELLKKDVYANRFHRDVPMRLGVIPRRGSSSDIKWFDCDATYVLHWINAFEDGDEIVIDGYFQYDPSPTLPPDATIDERLFRYLDLYAMQTRPYRWRLNMRTGAVKEGPLSDTITEFGIINGAVGGRAYDTAYCVIPTEGWFMFEGLIRHDIGTGRETRFHLPDGEYCSEAVFAPRLGATGEDDGYVITYTIDVVNDHSDCAIFDAGDIAAGPVARVRLPERISSGTHACWTNAS